jgi:hypothetical protein
MDIDTLYPLVTEAIRRPEALEDRRAPDARRAFGEVSRLEERIASLLLRSDYEGVIARRGAVRAAINAHEFDRARELAARFEGEDAIDDALAADLAALKAQASALAGRQNRKTGHSVRQASMRDRGDSERRLLASDPTQEAAVRAMEAVAANHGMATGRVARATKRTASDLIGETPPKPKKSV